MAVDMAEELRAHKVAIVSLWPGTVRTELLTKAAYSGKCDRSSDPNVVSIYFLLFSF